jgi:hypothetical protein
MTKEDRIFAHYKKLRRDPAICGRHFTCEKHWPGVSEGIWMPLARTWKMSIKDLKALIADMKETNRALQNPPSPQV